MSSYQFHVATRLASCLLGLAFAHTASAGLITFESTPSGAAATDDYVVPLNAWYESANGVRVMFGFSREADNDIDSTDIPGVLEDTSRSGIYVEYKDSSPVIEQRYGFVSYGADWGGLDSNGIAVNPTALITDTVSPGYEDQAGAFMLRSAQLGDAGYDRGAATDDLWQQFVIQFDDTNNVGVTGTTGEIWDIDYGNTAEQFEVVAFDVYGNELATKTSPLGIAASDPNSLDSKPWVFTFDSAVDGYSASIYKLVFNRTGGDPGVSYPLAFNNFNPVSSLGYSAVPEPATTWALAAALACTSICRRRFRMQNRELQTPSHSTD